MPVINSRYYLALAVLLPTCAFAASGTDDAIAECARISSTGDRILCLEDALRRLSASEEPVAIPEVNDEVLVADEAESLSVSVNAGDPDAIVATGAVEMAPIAAGTGAAISVASETTEEAASQAITEAAPGAASPASQPELGAEQVARQNDVDQEQVTISASIVEHVLVGTGRLRLTLDNGQVWQQTGDDDDRIARRIRGQTDIAIEMWQSRSGGYRMHLLEADRTLRVRRIR